MYQVEVRVKSLEVSEWLRRYCRPKQFIPLCRQCPQYEKNWACPPKMLTAEELSAPYHWVEVIGLKVIYDRSVLEMARESQEMAQKLRHQTYDEAKKRMLNGLLALEERFPHATTIMAGGCLLCPTCARGENKPCRHSEKLRYSYSGLGFDLGKIADELLEMPLLWASGGLAAYEVAVASFLH